VAGAQVGDRCVKRACRAGDQLGEFPLVVLVAGAETRKIMRAGLAGFVNLIWI